MADQVASVSYVKLQEVSSPGAPPTGTYLYAKSDKALYYINADGTETRVDKHPLNNRRVFSLDQSIQETTPTANYGFGQIITVDDTSTRLAVGTDTSSQTITILLRTINTWAVEQVITNTNSYSRFTECMSF